MQDLGDLTNDRDGDFGRRDRADIEPDRSADTREIVRTEAYIISYAHGDTGSVFGLIGGYSPTPISSDDNGGSVLITLPPDELEGFEQRLAEATAGRASIAG